MRSFIGAAVLTLAALIIIAAADYAGQPEFRSEAECIAAALRPIAKDRCQRNWQETREAGPRSGGAAVRAQKMADDSGLHMVPYYAQPDALRGPLAGLVDAICTDAGNGGLNISARTASLVADAKAVLGGPSEWHRDLIDREPDHGQYAKGGNANAATIVVAPPGWKLVPIEPTEDQLKAANAATLSTETLMDDARFACERAGYAAGIKAAPEPPSA